MVAKPKQGNINLGMVCVDLYAETVKAELYIDKIPTLEGEIVIKFT